MGVVCRNCSVGFLTLRLPAAAGTPFGVPVSERLRDSGQERRLTPLLMTAYELRRPSLAPRFGGAATLAGSPGGKLGSYPSPAWFESMARNQHLGVAPQAQTPAKG